MLGIAGGCGTGPGSSPQRCYRLEVDKVAIPERQLSAAVAFPALSRVPRLAKEWTASGLYDSDPRGDRLVGNSRTPARRVDQNPQIAGRSCKSVSVEAISEDPADSMETYPEIVGHQVGTLLAPKLIDDGPERGRNSPFGPQWILHIDCALPAAI